jgi:hypothetical protein
LAAEQYGSLLMAQVRRYGSERSLEADADGGVADAVCSQLVRMLSDPDTAVAEAASKALRTYGRCSTETLQRLLSSNSPTAAALAAAAASDERSGVVRLRVLSLVLELAAGGEPRQRR